MDNFKVAISTLDKCQRSKVYQRPAFGGYLSDFEQLDGYWLPTSVEAGDHFGTEACFSFFRATVDKLVFITSPEQEHSCHLP